ncbi:MAG: pilus assembly protein N-terminal domain-containing protein [Kiritimatiellae bacterium]|nr:pilus assembly protein N-terminal domain-containing protein [Kiritimatiellia bacterium]
MKQKNDRLSVMKVRGWRGVNIVLVLMAVVMSLAGVAEAQDKKQLVVTVGKMTIVDAPFAVKGFRVANPDIVKVETHGSMKLRIMGQKTGATDLQITGGKGLSAIYTIRVQENVKAVFAAIRNDLDTVPEVDISINMGRVTIRGEVSSIEHWKYLLKVLSLYQGSVVNLAAFRPAPEVMLALRDALRTAGYPVKNKSAKVKLGPGDISLRFAGENIYIGGSVYSVQDVKKIKNIISAQTWLVLNEEKDRVKDAALIKAILNVSVIPTMIEVDVAFAGVTDEENKQIGVNLAKAGLLMIDSTSAAFQGKAGKNRHGEYGGNYTINSGLKGALKFFAGSGPGRINSAAHMVFKNGSPDWRIYHSGGTLKVRVATNDRVGLDDIDYGLIMKVRGGLQDKTMVALDTKMELSYPVPIGTDYDVKKNKIDTSVLCPIGHTIVMGGMKSLIEQTSNEGVPFLRSIPVIQWLFSEQKSMKQESTILILLSPQIMGAPRASRPVSEKTISAEHESLMPVRKRQKKVKKKRRFFFF